MGAIMIPKFVKFLCYIFSMHLYLTKEDKRLVFSLDLILFYSGFDFYILVSFRI